MTYKLIQDRLAKLHNEEHPILYHHDVKHKVTTFFPWDRIGYTYGYIIPDASVAFDLPRCRELDRFPTPPCPVDEMLEIIPMEEIAHPLNKRKLVVFETRFGHPTYIAKRLVKHFPTEARFFQKEALGLVTVVMERVTRHDVKLVTVGYICPHRVHK